MMTNAPTPEENWDEKRRLIAESIDYVRRQFQREPASFLSERDVQAILFATLFPKFDRYSRVREVPYEYHQVFRKDDKLKMNPVKTEYRGQNVGPIDIAILSDLDDQNWWKIPVRVGIEIKLRQDRGSFLGGLPVLRDCEKLSRYRAQCQEMHFTGICLAFSHLTSCGVNDEECSAVAGGKIPVNLNYAEVLELIPDSGLCVFAFTHDHGDAM